MSSKVCSRLESLYHLRLALTNTAGPLVDKLGREV